MFNEHLKLQDRTSALNIRKHAKLLFDQFRTSHFKKYIQTQ